MRTLLQALSFGLFAGTALVYAGTGAATIFVSDTPTQVFCNGSNWVNHVIVSVVPGGEGKIYVGMATQNGATGAGVAQILFPNGGAHSEQFELSDPSGNDTINLCNLYLTGEITGEIALASWTYKNGTSTGSELVLVQAQPYLGPVPSSTPSGCGGLSQPFVPFASTGLLRDPALVGTDPNYYFDKIRVQVIPGQEGKIHLTWCSQVGGGYFHVLYPNVGMLSQHSAWSEGWELQDPYGQNGLSYYDGNAFPHPFLGWGFIPDVSSEGVQVAMWQLQSNSDVVDPATVYYFWGSNETPSSQMTGAAARLRYRVEPGYCGKVYFGDNTLNPATGTGLYKTLFPNCSGGWSEEFVAVPDSTVDVSVLVNIIPEIPTDAISSELLEVGPYGGLPVGSPYPPGCVVGGGTTVISRTPAPLGTTMVHRITISVTPGQTGMIYIGTASMSANLNGVIAILYPNAIGRWSEQFDLTDPLGDGIDLSALYIMGEVPGEYVQIVTQYTGVQSATPLSVNFANAVSFPGFCASSTYSFAVPLTGCPGSTPVTAIRIQAIPGLDPPVYVGTSAMLGDQEPNGALPDAVKVLYPNWGDYNVHEGFSETYSLACPDGTNCMTSDAFSLWPEYTYYPALVAIWQH